MVGSPATWWAASPHLPLRCRRYAATPLEVDWLCQQLLQELPSVIGLDVEWRPTYK
jgi:hypothetical protein